MNRIVTSESVTEGHPDKVADQISDAVLDAALTQDSEAHVACETLVTTGLVVVAGEMSSSDGAEININPAELARTTLCRIGYDDDRYGINGSTCAVMVAMDEQSHDIATGVTTALEERSGVESGVGRGAGDQGMMYGFASDEHPTLLPRPIAYAHALSRRLAEARRIGDTPFGPDGKTMVTVGYEGLEPKQIESILVSTQHDEAADRCEVEAAVRETVLAPVLDGVEGFDDCEVIVNPSGRFVLGGPHADCGLTGRKIIVDTYGGVGRHGGGAFSGKDPSKVDRSAAYACRWVAKNLVAAGAAARCELQVSYAIGRAAPVSVAVDTFGTENADPEAILAAVGAVFDLRPAAIVEALDLRRPIYGGTAAYGHFGRDEAWCTWEKLDRVGALRSELRLN